MSVAAQRMTAQRIARPLKGKPADLVSWMGAVQAQDYGASKWAVGLRLAGAEVSDATIARATDDGSECSGRASSWAARSSGPGAARSHGHR